MARDENRSGFFKDKYGRWMKNRRSAQDRRLIGGAVHTEQDRRRMCRRKHERLRMAGFTEDWLTALDDEGKTPLSRGLGSGHDAIAHLLVTLAGGDVNPESEDPGLHEAARRADVRRARKFIDGGADVDAQDSYGLAPLHWAGINGSLDLAKLLTHRGANLVALSTQLGGLTPLGIAKLMQYQDLAEFLASRGAMI